ncbi:Serpentine Receptor, class T [Caenorhabditis elegans]|nr:Serpentine Receptor, class T [Caenorhabditis elegans]CDR32792.2 Serpentine Receptor, class T [Caenorhabditis elegans]|eukprot:NP_001343704.1 Serpentine Receptor, class U [Caenorhabditis elegans]
MIYPVLLIVVRITPIQYPQSHREINSKILAYSIPFIHIYPIFFILHMIPALGVCRQLWKPYPFGCAFIHFYGSWHDLKNSPFEVINSVLWLIIFLICNFKLYQKIQNLKGTSRGNSNVNQSSRYRRAEISLTLTSGSMILTYIVNFIFQASLNQPKIWNLPFFQGTFIINFTLMTYSSFFRPYGYDLETCVVPWMLYLTHPAFQKRKESITVTPSLQRERIP